MLAGSIFLLGTALAYRPSVEASSHRDSPFISEDPAADNTDVYAFVSYEPGRENYVTLLSNFVPLQEPANGPNFYKLSDFVNYEIHVDVDGDAKEDLTYQFKFITRIVDPGSYLSPPAPSCRRSILPIRPRSMSISISRKAIA